jgi:hypothetical protein
LSLEKLGSINTDVDVMRDSLVTAQNCAIDSKKSEAVASATAMEADRKIMEEEAITYESCGLWR